jgi:hypothetical protein
MKDFIDYFFFFGVFVVPLVIFFIVFFITKKSLKRGLSLSIFLSLLSLIFLSIISYIADINNVSIINIFGNTIYFGSFCVPIVVFFSITVMTKGRSFIARLSIAFSFSVASFIFLTTLWFAIAFRDGLGPDSIISNGSVALNRSIENVNIYWLIFSFAFFILGFIIIKISSSSGSNKK